MNCTDVATILDDHAHPRLTAAERCALDEHVTSCEPCAHAWRAQTALLALPLPATPADLVERALNARAARAPRRARTRIAVVGAVLAAGAVFAAATAVRLLERAGDRTAAATAEQSDARDSAPTQTASPEASAAATIANSADGGPLSVEDVQSEYVMMIRVPPEYPRGALERKLDGDVTLEYTIDKRGSVKDVRAVRSSDPQFEAPAIAAASQWKYLPRVTAGKRVEVHGVNTVIRFTMTMPPAAGPPAGAKSGENVRRFQLTMPPPAQSSQAKSEASAAAPEPAHPADHETFDRSSAIAWQRAADEDFRGAELELDELRATYDLDDRQSNQVWAFYGYIYTQYGDYGRAIDAYEKAVESNTSIWPGQWTSLASLYFARHQYDKALTTLLAYKQRSSSGRIAPEVAAMIERLRALGVTEETL
jgi:TonB family protein